VVYETEGRLAPIASDSFIGIIGNFQHQKRGGVFPQSGYDLGIIEFDDQGRCFDNRAQMHAIMAKIDAMWSQDVIVIVFVHGWKHNARTKDDNLRKFQQVLADTVTKEKAASVESGGSPRPVFGIFAGWRGMSLYDGFHVSQNFTFWGRQAAARRVAVGSVRELFGRVRQFREYRINESQGKAGNSQPLLVIVGHSFGGLIVFSALAQSLIEAASAPFGSVTPRFADLVLLVNPAFEAGRYLPIHDLVVERQASGKSTRQPPVFACVTAKNDWATGLAFPIGTALALITQSFKGSQERDAAVRTVGHVPWMMTHQLEERGSGYECISVDGSDADRNPFWVAQASPAVINGHNDIFNPRFLAFAGDLVFAHVRHSRRLGYRLPTQAAVGRSP
jgi:pimeloyl-ACP methyl ester carboxylesterase